MAHKEQSLVRELRPHAVWKGIELGGDMVWDGVRAVVLTALVTAWQWFQHHWDITMIVGVFAVSFFLLLWRDMSQRRQFASVKSGQDVLPDSDAGGRDHWMRAAVTRDAKLEEANKQITEKDGALEKMTQALLITAGKLSACEADKDRLDHHIKDLTGKPIQPQEQSIPVKLEHKPSHGEDRARLIFKVRPGSPAVTITNIGPLVSEERYYLQQTLHALPGKLPELDPGESAECQFYADLENALEKGGPMTLDSISIDYTVAGQSGLMHSQYFLHKNADGSIVFSTEKPNVDPKSLAELRNRLLLLKDAARAIDMAALYESLAGDIAIVREGLESAWSHVSKDGVQSDQEAFSYPLRTAILSESRYTTELRQFQRLYVEHLVRAEGAKVHYCSLLKNAGDATAQYHEVLDAIHKYQMTLTNMAALARRTYAAIAETEIPKAAIS